MPQHIDLTLLETAALEEGLGPREQYSTFEFTLRLSPEIHARIARLEGPIRSSADLEFEDV